MTPRPNDFLWRAYGFVAGASLVLAGIAFGIFIAAVRIAG